MANNEDSHQIVFIFTLIMLAGYLYLVEHVFQMFGRVHYYVKITAGALGFWFCLFLCSAIYSLFYNRKR